MQNVEIADNSQCGANKDKNVKGTFSEQHWVARISLVPPCRHGEGTVREGHPQGHRQPTCESFQRQH